MFIRRRAAVSLPPRRAMHPATVLASTVCVLCNYLISDQPDIYVLPGCAHAACAGTSDAAVRCCCRSSSLCFCVQVASRSTWCRKLPPAVQRRAQVVNCRSSGQFSDLRVRLHPIDNMPPQPSTDGTRSSRSLPQSSTARMELRRYALDRSAVWCCRVHE